MKKLFIGALVGGMLVFTWQSLSWTLLNLHEAEYKQAPNQDALISSLSQLEEGQYMVPRANENATTKEMEDFQKKMLDEKKPWAVINYHKVYKTDMTMNMIRGLIVTLIAAFLVCWVLMKQTSSFGTTFLSSLFIGVAGYLFIPYSGHIWFENPGATTHLIDAIVSWGLCGIWLGWWLNRK
jgi:hypothetical protein